MRRRVSLFAWSAAVCGIEPVRNSIAQAASSRTASSCDADVRVPASHRPPPPKTRKRLYCLLGRTTCCWRRLRDAHVPAFVFQSSCVDTKGIELPTEVVAKLHCVMSSRRDKILAWLGVTEKSFQSPSRHNRGDRRFSCSSFVRLLPSAPERISVPPTFP